MMKNKGKLNGMTWLSRKTRPTAFEGACIQWAYVGYGDDPANLDHIGIAVYDDTIDTWFGWSNGIWTFKPNEGFDWWLFIPNVTNAQSA